MIDRCEFSLLVEMTEAVPVESQNVLSYEKRRPAKERTQKATSGSGSLKTLLQGILSPVDSYRYECYKVLAEMSEKKPGNIYQEWKWFQQLLNSENSYQRGIAVNILAELTKVDRNKRFENIFYKYFGLLDDESLMVARYVAKNAGMIFEAKPELENKITSELLRFAKKSHFDRTRKDLVVSDMLRSLGEKSAQSKVSEKLLALAGTLAQSGSPSARKVGKWFLERRVSG